MNFAMGLPAKSIKHLVSIVHPETVLRWVRESRNAARDSLTDDLQTSVSKDVRFA